MKKIIVLLVLLVSVNKVLAEGPPVEWEKTFGGSLDDLGISVKQTMDGGYIIAGSTNSYGAGNDDLWIIKVDFDGNDIWNNTFGGSGHDFANSVQQTTDGGYVIAGKSSSYGAGNDDVYIIKLSADCIDQPRSDLTGDCKVDFRDFAVIASEWLDCNLDPPETCRE